MRAEIPFEGGRIVQDEGGGLEGGASGGVDHGNPEPAAPRDDEGRLGVSRRRRAEEDKQG